MENFKFLVSLLLHLKNMETQTAKTAKNYLILVWSNELHLLRSFLENKFKKCASDKFWHSYQDNV